MRRWNDTDDERVVRMLSDDRSLEWIGRKIGRTAGAVQSRVSTKGLNGRIDRMVRARCQEALERWVRTPKGTDWVAGLWLISFPKLERGRRVFVVKGRTRGKLDTVSRFLIRREVPPKVGKDDLWLVWSCELLGVKKTGAPKR